MIAFLRRLRPRRGVYVRLMFEDGGKPARLGPMDRFTAEVFLAHRLAPDPTFGSRRVASARIIGEGA
mgnify:CR=1 FL=1